MRKINIFFICLSLVWGLGEAFSASPYELLRYNARFCKGDLKRVVYATLKSHTHRGCLKAGRAKLENPKSKLYNKFDHPYAVNPAIIVRKNHRLETKEILIAAIAERLGATPIQENLRLMQSTDLGKKLFREDIASFCARMGNYELLSNSGHGRGKKPDFKKLDADLILTKITEIDLYRLFKEYRLFLTSIEQDRKIHPQKKKMVLKDFKGMRESFLILLDNLVVLKKRLSQPNDANFTQDQLFAQRTNVKDALVNLSGQRAHVLHIKRILQLLHPKMREEDETFGILFPSYSNLFALLNILRYTDLLNDQCLRD